MIGLARAVLEHREAIEYDLLTKTGHEINDVGRTFSWDALDSFFKHIGPDSALMRELHPDVYEWGSVMKTNKILADIYDQLAWVNANLVAIGSKQPARKPKPYPRPGVKRPDEEKRFGRDPLPPAELRKWFEAKRKQLCRK